MVVFYVYQSTGVVDFSRFLQNTLKFPTHLLNTFFQVGDKVETLREKTGLEGGSGT